MTQPPWQLQESTPWHHQIPDATPDCTRAPERAAPVSLADAMRMLHDQGGWESTLSPRAAWTRALGTAYPYPDGFRDFPTFGPLDRLLLDPQITDIHLNGPGREVLVRRSGSATEWHIGSIWHPDWFAWLITQCAQRGSGHQSPLRLSGTVEATCPGRTLCRIRYEILLPPACLHGPALTLRVLRPGTHTLARLVEQAMLPAPIASLVASAVTAGVNLIIVGTPGTGKTTLVRALLSQEQLDDLRAICIEDVPELTLNSPSSIELTASDALSMLQLVYTAQRMNPAHIILGEVRGAEAYALLAAMRAGTPIVTTVHGLSAANGLDALIGMALEAPEAQGSLDLVRMNLNSQPLLVLALQRVHGQRRVTELAEVLPNSSAQHPLLQVRWRWDDGVHTWQLISPLSDALIAQIQAANPLWEPHAEMASTPVANLQTGRTQTGKTQTGRTHR